MRRMLLTGHTMPRSDLSHTLHCCWKDGMNDKLLTPFMLVLVQLVFIIMWCFPTVLYAVPANGNKTLGLVSLMDPHFFVVRFFLSFFFLFFLFFFFLKKKKKTYFSTSLFIPLWPKVVGNTQEESRVLNRPITIVAGYVSTVYTCISRVVQIKLRCRISDRCATMTYVWW